MKYMSDELFLNTQLIKRKLLDISKEHPFLIPSDAEIRYAYDVTNFELARAIHDGFDKTVIRKAESDYVNPSDPNLPNIVNGCAESCNRGDCKPRCQNALRIFSQMRNGNQMMPGQGNEGLMSRAKRTISGNVKTLNRYTKNKRLSSIVSEVENEIDSDIRNHPDSAAYAINKELRKEITTRLTLDTNKFKEAIMGQSMMTPYAYTAQSKSARQKTFGRGAATSDMALAFQRTKNVSSVLGELNGILAEVDANGGQMNDSTATKLSNFMNRNNDHLIGYDRKVAKLMKDSDFLNGYIEEMRTQSGVYNEKTFNSAFRDGKPETEKEVMMALRDLPMGSTEAARVALEELGKKNHGDEGYKNVFQTSVNAHMAARGKDVMKSYANKATPEERQMFIADVMHKSPYLNEKINEFNTRNKELAAKGIQGKWDINKWESLPADMQQDIAKGVIKDLYQADGNKGVVNATRYFGKLADDKLVKQSMKEYHQEKAKGMREDWSDYSRNKDVAPTLNELKTNPDNFAKMDSAGQQQMKETLDKEMDAVADKNGIDKDSDAYKLAKSKTLSEFIPMSDEARKAVQTRNDNFSKPITRSDGMRMYVADLYKQPIDFYSQNKNLVADLMFDKSTGQYNAFGKYMRGLMDSAKTGYNHPIFAPKQMQTLGMGGLVMQPQEKTEGEVQKDIRDAIDSVPPQYRDKIFNDRIRGYAYSQIGKGVSQQLKDYQNDGSFQATAKRMGVNPADQASYDKLADLANHFAYASNVTLKTPADVLNYTEQLENKLANEDLSDQDVDVLSDAIAKARGPEHASDLITKRYMNSLKNADDEGAALSLYSHASSFDKRGEGYQKYLDANPQMGTSQPTKPRNYREWRKYQIASGGKNAQTQIKNARMMGDDEAVFGQLTKDIESSMNELSAKAGKPLSLKDLASMNDPMLSQEISEYMKTMEDIALKNRSDKLGKKYLELRDQGVFDSNAQKEPTQTISGLLSSPDDWSRYFSEAGNAKYEILNQPPSVTSEKQFNNLYQGMQTSRQQLASKKRSPKEDSQLRAMDMMIKIANQQAGKTWDEAKPAMVDATTKELLNAFPIESTIQPGQETTYAQLAKKNAFLANSLNLLRNVDPVAYDNFANKVYESPGGLAEKMNNGSLFSPAGNPRYKRPEDRISSIQKIIAANNDDAAMSRYIGVPVNDPRYAQMKADVNNAALGSEEGYAAGRDFMSNPDDPNKMVDIAKKMKNAVLSKKSGLTMQPQDRLSFSDKDIAKIPDKKRQYALREIKNFLSQGRVEDRSFFDNLSVGGDGMFYFGNEQGVPPEQLPVLFESHKQRLKEMQRMYGNYMK